MTDSFFERPFQQDSRGIGNTYSRNNNRSLRDWWKDCIFRSNALQPELLLRPSFVSRTDQGVIGSRWDSLQGNTSSVSILWCNTDRHCFYAPVVIFERWEAGKQNPMLHPRRDSDSCQQGLGFLHDQHYISIQDKSKCTKRERWENQDTTQDDASVCGDGSAGIEANLPGW